MEAWLIYLQVAPAREISSSDVLATLMTRCEHFRDYAVVAVSANQADPGATGLTATRRIRCCKMQPSQMVNLSR